MSLSHSNILVKEISFLYCLAIKHILLNLLTREEIYLMVKKYAKENYSKSSDLLSWFTLIE